MKLTTIWLMPGMTFKAKMHETMELATRTAAHRLPRRLAYWSFIDSGVRHMKPGEIVPEVRYMDLLGRMDKA